MNFGDKFNQAEIDDIFGEFEVDDDGFLESKAVIGLFVAGGGEEKKEEKKEEEAAPAADAPAEGGELKDRIQDALCATRAASDEGIVVGGGAALLYASRKLDSIDTDNFDQNVGIKIVREACKIPTKAICMNAGFEGSIVVDKLLEAGNEKNGYDASKGEYVDMKQAGIV